MNLSSKLVILDALLSRVTYTHYAVITCVALCLPDLHKSGRSASCMCCAQPHEGCSCVFEFVLLAGQSAQLHTAARQERNNPAYVRAFVVRVRYCVHLSTWQY